MPTVRDQDMRLRVLADLNSTLIVEAGAGTGKTALMAGRVAMLLAASVPPREIAAITFTEAAASELFERIVDYVRDLREARIPQELSIAFTQQVSTNQIENLSRAIASLDELTCSTIHSFCQQLTKPYPVEACLDPGAVIMDDVQAALAHDMLFEKWLRNELNETEDDRPVAVLLVEKGAQGRRLIEQIVAAQQNRRGTQSPPSRLSVQLVDDFRASVSNVVSICDRAARLGLVEDTTRTYVEGFQTLSDFYAGQVQPQPSFRKLLELTAPRDIAAFKKGSYELREYRCKGAWQSAAQAAGQPRTVGTQFNDELSLAYDQVRGALTALLDALGETVLSRLASALDGFSRAYTEHKRSSALLDFDDLIYHARDLLRNSPATLDTLSARYRHILVDEFQDTDPLQAEILFLLCGDGPQDLPWHEMRLRPGQLFVVGDPKQSIYRFRRADIACYEQVRSALLNQFPDSKIEITANFRSQEPILAFVNDRFSQPFANLGFAPLSCTLEGTPRSDSRVLTLAIECPADARSQDRRRVEAEQVARFCRSLLDNFQVRTKNGLEPCRPRHIALLAPSSTDLWTYEYALEQLGIPLSTQAGKGFFLRQEIQDIIAITRILSNRRDTVALGALMRGPLVGLTEEELLDIVGALPRSSDTGDYASLSVTTPPHHIPHPIASDTLKVLSDLSRRAYSTTPFDIVSAAIEGLQVRPLLLVRHPQYSERALANVDLFLDLARQYNVRGLRVFARDMMRRWDAAERQIEGRADAGVDTIQIITVHAAKGLEWPVVIPINMLTETRGAEGVLFDPTRNALLCQFEQIRPASYTALKESETEQHRKERVRIWYVCCTRARDMLAIPHHTNGSGARSWFAEIDLRLTELPVAQIGTLSPYLSACQDAGNSQTPEVFQKEAETLSRRIKQIRWATPSIGEDREDRAPMPRDSQEMVIVQSDAPPIAGSSARGRILHKLLEEALIGAIRDDREALAARAAALIAQLDLQDFADPQLGISSRELAEAVARTLSLPHVQKYRPRLLPEWNLYASLETEPGNFDATAGIADAIAYDNEDRPEFIFDWKSDISPENATEGRHCNQLRQYLTMAHCPRGAVVYITTGKMLELTL